MLGTLSKVFAKVVARRNRNYDAHKRPIVQVSVPVISVGNVSVGGTGKTPIVQMIVRMLQQAGHKPAVVMRGYKRSTRGHLVVHDGTSLLATVREAGDEAFLHAKNLGVPVVVDEDKVEAARYAAGHLECDVIVVDDGFQHRALHRDLDIVLVDEATLSDQRLLPAGRLREPLESLRRADVVFLMGKNVDKTQVLRIVGAESTINTIEIIGNLKPEALSFKLKALGFCGIANSSRFFASADSLGIDVIEQLEFKDHHVYVKSDIEKIIKKAKSLKADVVTTEKDVVKLEHARPMFDNAGIAVYVVGIRAEIANNASAFEAQLLNTISTSINAHENSTE